LVIALVLSIWIDTQFFPGLLGIHIEGAANGNLDRNSTAGLADLALTRHRASTDALVIQETYARTQHIAARKNYLPVWQ